MKRTLKIFSTIFAFCLLPAFIYLPFFAQGASLAHTQGWAEGMRRSLVYMKWDVFSPNSAPYYFTAFFICLLLCVLWLASSGKKRKFYYMAALFVAFFMDWGHLVYWGFIRP